MKIKLLIIALLAVIFANAQSPTGAYTNINQRYNWLVGYFRGLGLPVGCDTSTALEAKQWRGAGQIYYDSCDHIIYIWDKYWRLVQGGSGSGYSTTQIDSIVYSITPRMSLGPSLISIPVFVGVNPYTGEDVYADSLLFENDQAIGVDKYYGFSSSGIRMYNNTSDLKFGWGDNIMNQNRSVTQNGYSFSFLGSTNTIRFRPDGAVQMGNAGTMIPDRTNGITDFAHWLYDTAGSSVRAERYYFTSVSPQPVGDTLRTKANVSYIWSPQGDMLALKAQTALRIQSPYVSFDQSTIMNIGGSAPLIFSGCCAGALTPLIDVHMDDSAKTAALGSYGARAKWSGRKQGYAQQDFGYLDFVGTDSSTAASKARFDLYVNHNNTPTKRFSIDNLGTVSINKWSIPAQRMLVINTDNSVDTLAIPTGSGTGVTDGDKGDITVSGSGSTYTVDNNAITDAKLRQSAGLSVVGNSSNSTGNVADITAGSDGNVLRRSGTAVGFGAINLASSNAVTGTLPDANISSASTWNAKQAAISETDNNLTFSSNVLGTNKAVQTLTDGATITWDASTGFNARVVLGGNRTLAITNPQQGDYYTITVVQDGTGSRTLTLPGGGSAPLNSAANDSITLTAYYRNSAYEWRGGAVNLASTSEVTGITGAANGGTGNGFTAFTGPTTSTKTFTLPNATATILTTNALVTAAQGGTNNGFFAVSGPASSTKTFTFPNASATVLTDNAVVTGAQGGTGVANSGKTITVSGNTSIGSSTNTVAFTTSGNTSIALPTTGTVATLAGTESLTNKRVSHTAGTTSASTAPQYFASGSLMTTPEAGAKEYNNAHYETNNALNRFALGGAIADFYTDANNSGTTETDLYSYTTKASTLAANGEKIELNFAGSTTGSATATRAMAVYFGGTKIFDSGNFSNLIDASGTEWRIRITIIRVSSTTIRLTGQFTAWLISGATSLSFSDYGELTGLTLSNTNIIKLTGLAQSTGAGSSQITARMGTISWIGAANN